MNKKITVISGDGIGPEIMNEAIKVLDCIQEKYNHKFDYDYKLAGGIAIDECGECLPQDTIDSCLSTDSTLLGAVGGYKWDNLEGHLRPEKALLGIRKLMKLYSNIRPCVLYESLKDCSPLKESILEKGIDFLIVRELTGGIYFGEHSTECLGDKKVAKDIMMYNTEEIERITKVAINLAKARKSKITVVDKANVLDTSRLWREVTQSVLKSHDNIEYDYMYVDNCAMQLIKDPSRFDVILTENMFGDILSDEASMLTGTIGNVGSFSMGYGDRGMYEPIHGSAPDIAGKGIANPIGMISSASMMLRYSFGMEEEANLIDRAISSFYNCGYRTKDLAMKDSENYFNTKEVGDYIINYILKY